MLTCEPVCWLEFQSTLSVRRATHPHQRRGNRLHISIHALRKESDSLYHVASRTTVLFQSTLSVRRATALCWAYWRVYEISIHALRKESDL